MKAIDRKLLRDLWEMRGQALAIALVIVSGVGTYIMSLSTLHSLQRTQKVFYEESRFADVFVSVKRAPESLRQRILAIPGVDLVETRVVASVNLDLPDFSDPVTGRLVSIPDEGPPLLNRLKLRKGRAPLPGRDGEVVVSEAFAEAHGFGPGSEFRAIINGRRKALTVVGTALSAEYTYQLRPGGIIPDFKRYGIVWMARTPLGNAYDMEGAFNDVVLRTARGASIPDVIDRLDILLARYGGLGAYSREDQLSHRFLSEEFRQLEGMATIFPVIFLSVAAFLLNVVMSRLISTQREQIAALKAFGYGNLAVGWHYAKLVIVIAVAGGIGGIGAGVWLGEGLSSLYTDFYRFPYLEYVLKPSVAITSVLVSALAALFGTLHAVRTAARLPPAEAMRPEPPARYRESLIEKLGLKRFLSQPSRMIVRNLERRPVKSLLSMLGLALSCSILMVGSFQADAIDFLIRVQFGLAQREDISVSFVEPTSRRAIHELRSLEGIEHAEPYRSVPCRLVFENRSYRTGITGIESGGDLHRILNTDLKAVELPPEGIVLNEHLGKILGIQPGDLLTVRVLEGSRPVRRIPVVSFVRQFIGVAAYMELSALARVLREGDAISGVHLAADSLHTEEIYGSLEEMPRVAGTTVRKHAIESFYETMAQTTLIFTFINTILAGSIAVGVVYNSARIAFSERSRELASLRVLGFTRGEISYILLGELAALTLAGIPLGFVVGRGLCGWITASIQNDLYRIPLILEPRTFAFSATVVLVAAVVSGCIVRRKLDRLDLVAVLKTKE